MSDTTFVAGTPIRHEWLNDVNDAVYTGVFSGSSITLAGSSGNKAIIGRSATTFNGTIDNTTLFGYNISQTGASSIDSSDSTLFLEFESNYNDGSFRQAEFHVDMGAPGQTVIRPFSAQLMLTGPLANQINDTALFSNNTITLSAVTIELNSNKINFNATGSARLSVSTANALGFQTNSVDRWAITATGHFVALTDNTYDLGDSGSTRPRTVYVGTSVVSPSISLSAGTTLIAPLKIPHGSAPTSPVNGDIWTTTSGLFIRVNGSTVGPLT